MNSIEMFEKHAAEYDQWFEENEAVYKSEILALRDLISAAGIGLEAGVGIGCAFPGSNNTERGDR